MGDGSLIEARVCIETTSNQKITSTALLTQKRVTLGSHPIRLSPFTYDNRYYVFAGCDRPSIIYQAKSRAYYNNINSNEMNYLCGFNAEEYPNSLAMAVDQQLMIGSMNETQKIHIQKVPLNEQPRRVAYNAPQRLYLLATNAITEYPVNVSENRLDFENNFFHPHFNKLVTRLHLLSDQTFEPLFSKTLKPHWFVSRIIAHRFKCDPHATYFIVGCAKAPVADEDVSRGKLNIYLAQSISGNQSNSSNSSSSSVADDTNTIHNGQITLRRVCHRLFKNASPDVIAPLGDNHLVVGVKKPLCACVYESKISLFEWIPSSESERNDYPFTLKCLHTAIGSVRALDIKTHGNLIVVGDIMHSVQMYEFSPRDNTIQEIAHAPNPSWSVCVATYDTNYVVTVDNNHNLFAYMRSANSSTNDERSSLQIIARYHIGTHINVLLKGSLVTESVSSDEFKRELSYEDQKSAEVTSSLITENKESDQKEITQTAHKSKGQKDITWDVSSLKSEYLSKFLFGTSDGSIGVLLSIPKDRFKLLSELEKVLNAYIDGIGNFKLPFSFFVKLHFYHTLFSWVFFGIRHSDWRQVKDKKIFPAVGFVDGDIIQKLLELAPEQQQKIAQEIGVDINTLTLIVEEMIRLH
ncbi:hypothetical protein RFI_07039 [Reticulomyxa filosa]|uniref:Uncharacterized protein n=1 Tax=Reticulomyxa filosa TaxID=46433 RepID=X6NUU8_RETFI|nr:hypothetical protein RFI_07039 [Reticulomyxa filosa]|eukprot:ETO30080.1 hypothetical protein RFI_07039 [Reticulomyxa filosa]